MVTSNLHSSANGGFYVKHQNKPTYWIFYQFPYWKQRFRFDYTTTSNNKKIQKKKNNKKVEKKKQNYVKQQNLNVGIYRSPLRGIHHLLRVRPVPGNWKSNSLSKNLNQGKNGLITCAANNVKFHANLCIIRVFHLTRLSPMFAVKNLEVVSDHKI